VFWNGVFDIIDLPRKFSFPPVIDIWEKSGWGWVMNGKI
jgi:hypothetical protein